MILQMRSMLYTGHDMDDAQEHKKCYTCGTWAVKAELINDIFCSLPCKELYARCDVCGKFHAKTTFHAEGVCSVECNRTYTFANNSYILQEETV